MAQEYARVLHGLGRGYEAIGRGATSADQFAAATGHAIRRGGTAFALEELAAPEVAIVAVGIESLAAVVAELIVAGVRRIMVEKPGGLNTSQIRALQRLASTHEANVLVAYNRRFYASTTVARQLICDDGGATSCTFEFTEWSHVVGPLTTAAEIKNSWLLANSTHVIDLVFHLCGQPREWRAWHQGSLGWHPAASRFCGSGVTERDVLFSYHADWEAPGRWGVEVLTRKRRFVFRPIEHLQVMALGSVRVDSVAIDDQLDKAFKPGLFRQTEAFLARDDRLLCTIDDQLRHCAIYDEIAGYPGPVEVSHGV